MNGGPCEAAPVRTPVEPDVNGAGLIASALMLAYVVQSYKGSMTGQIGIALAAALMLAVAGVLLPGGHRSRRWQEVAIALGGVAAVAYGAVTFIVSRGDVNLQINGSPSAVFVAGVCAAGLLVLTALSRRPLLGRAHIPLLLVVCVVLGIWVLRARPVPAIDVYLFHDEALKALLAGRSPYSTTIPNIYGELHHQFYGDGLVVDGRVLVGHPYPPLSLLLTVPAYLAGDYRYALVVAMVGAAGLLAYCAPGRTPRVAAALLLFMPRLFFVERQGWSDVFMVLALAAVAFCALRARRALPFALGALLATKQYSLLALPLVVLLLPRPVRWREVWRLAGIALLVAAVLTVPFVVWDPRGFVNSVLLFQVAQPYRPDSLGFLPMLANARAAFANSTVSVIAAAIALALCLWRAPRTPAGFAGAVALTSFALFGFAKQAFWNYYLFVSGAMACAVAAGAAGPSRDATQSAPFVP